MFDSPQKAEDFISSLSQQKMYAVALRGKGKTAATISPARREGLDGRMEAVLAAQEGMMARWTWMLVEPVFFFFFSPLSYWDIVTIYPVQRYLRW